VALLAEVWQVKVAALLVLHVTLLLSFFDESPARSAGEARRHLLSAKKVG